MTTIHNRVSSLVVQTKLSRAIVDLQKALVRMSPGRRNVTVTDGPVGLIEGGPIRSNLASVEKAISETERANQMIAAVDSALGQVAALLNGLRDAVGEAKDSGARSFDRLAADQVRVDSALEAINRVAQNASYRGDKLLDGSLDFTTIAQANFDELTDLNIYQASLDTAGKVDVKITVSAAATQGKITATVPASTSPAAATLTPTSAAREVSGIPGTPVAGADAVTGLRGDLVFELRGNLGTEVFHFAQNTAGGAIAEAINLVSDATGVAAAFAGTTLTLTSAAYGQDAFVAVNVISDAGGFEASLSRTREAGTDVEATVNGVTADGHGNTLSVNTAALDLQATVAAGATGTIELTITGGGAVFRIGDDVARRRPVRIGIGSVDTAHLGGSSGRLCEIGSGQCAALATDAAQALRIVDQAARKVTSLRGRLGAFQKATIEADIYTLNEHLANLTDADGAIHNADFAAQAAGFTRAQIMVQSGISVLSIANSNPQDVLALLQ